MSSYHNIRSSTRRKVNICNTGDCQSAVRKNAFIVMLCCKLATFRCYFTCFLCFMLGSVNNDRITLTKPIRSLLYLWQSFGQGQEFGGTPRNP